MSLMEHYRKMLVYDAWANAEIVSELETISNPPPRSLRWLAHILSAEILWLERLQHKPQTYPVWPEFNLSQCKVESKKLAAIWKAYLSSLGESGLDETIAYKNSQGEAFTSKKGDVVQHVIIHSTHHRGQIVADLRASRYNPPYIDFIHAVRKNLLE
jgi:uncharacterized damage-inducible protein DinB